MSAKRLTNRARRRGFSLIELMVVILILGLLGGIVGVNVMSRVRRARVVAAQTQIRVFHNAVQAFYLDTGQYPDPAEGLIALIVQPAGVTGYDPSGYLDGVSEIPADPWRHEYMYLYPGDYSEYDIFSYGADGKQGGEDDNADIYNSDTNKTGADFD